MKISGVTFVSTKEERKRFTDFVYQLYKGTEQWVQPLRMDQQKLINEKTDPCYNKAEIALVLAEKDGKDVGRIAAIIEHRYNKQHNSKAGQFGFFDCIDDQHTADLLLTVASDCL